MKRISRMMRKSIRRQCQAGTCWGSRGALAREAEIYRLARAEGDELLEICNYAGVRRCAATYAGARERGWNIFSALFWKIRSIFQLLAAFRLAKRALKLAGNSDCLDAENHFVLGSIFLDAGLFFERILLKGRAKACLRKASALAREGTLQEYEKADTHVNLLCLAGKAASCAGETGWQEMGEMFFQSAFAAIERNEYELEPVSIEVAEIAHLEYGAFLMKAGMHAAGLNEMKKAIRIGARIDFS